MARYRLRTSQGDVMVNGTRAQARKIADGIARSTGDDVHGELVAAPKRKAKKKAKAAPKPRRKRAVRKVARKAPRKVKRKRKARAKSVARAPRKVVRKKSRTRRASSTRKTRTGRRRS